MTREEKRNIAAEKVCREVRYQLSTYGAILDAQKLWNHFEKWFKVSKKNRYIRPDMVR